MSNPINAPLLGTDSSGNLIPVTPSPTLLAITGSPGTQILGLKPGANLGLASAAVPLATKDAAGNATIALQQWEAASRHGQLVPLAFVENNGTYGTANVFASDARAVAAGFTLGTGYTVNQTAIAQAALTCSLGRTRTPVSPMAASALMSLIRPMSRSMAGRPSLKLPRSGRVPA